VSWRRYKGWWVLALVLLAALTPSAGADELPSDPPTRVATSRWGSEPITLAAAVSRALEESYETRIARLERGRVDDQLSGSRGAYWPQLSVSAQAGYSNRQNERFTALNEDFEPRTYGLANLGNDPWLSVVFDQVLLDLRRWRELERDELASEIAAITQREHAERVALDVVRRYALLLRAQSLEQIASEQSEAAAWLDQQAEGLADAGRLLGGEREHVQIEREAAQLEHRAASAEVAAARRALWLAIEGGAQPEHWPGVVAASLPEVSSQPAPEPSDDDLGNGLASAPDLRILGLQRRVHDASVAAAKAARYPTLQLRGGYAHYGIKRYDNFDDEAYVFVGIEVPIFDGFQAASQIAGARKGARVARLEYHSALDGKRVRVEDLERKLAFASDRVALAERRVNASIEAQRLADLQLKSQRGRLADAQLARETTRRDRRAVADLRFERIEIWATLQRERGLLASSLLGVSRAP
jgi:outer membrane protein TolC